MKLLFVFLFLLAASTLRAQEEAVVLHTQSGDLYGTITTPEQKNNIPVVLIIPASGPTDRDGNNPMMKTNTLKMLAEELQKNGIASLRYDKRGAGESKAAGANESELLFADYVNDAREWVNLLKQDRRFSGIIVAGHSEGSQIGMLTAAGNPDVKKFISLSGPGEPAAAVFRRQMATQPEQIQKIANPIIDKLEKGDTTGNVHPFLYSVFRPSAQPYLISWFKLDPAETIKQLNIPVLLLQGNMDIQVVENDANLLKAAYPQAEEHIINQMTHSLKNCDSRDLMTQMQAYSNLNLPLNPELIQYVIGFIKK